MNPLRPSVGFGVGRGDSESEQRKCDQRPV